MTLENFVEKMVELDQCKKEDQDLIIYGLTMGREIVVNFITLILMGLSSNSIVEGIVFYISFSAIRTYAGGYHCKKGMNCYIFSSFIMVLFYAILKLMPFEYMGAATVGVLLVSVPVLVRYAPIATNRNLLEGVERRYFRKKIIINLIIEVILTCLLFVIGWLSYAFVVSLGIFVSGILVVIKIMLHE